MNTFLEKWFRIRYTIYSPLYDFLVGSQFMKQRKRSILLAEIKSTDKVLIVGAGTGLDLKYLDNGAKITAIDIAEGMLFFLKKRAKKLKVEVDVAVMDARNIAFSDESFDVVLLHMIVAVVPDYRSVMKEVNRVVKPGGVVMIFDKMLPENQKTGFLRKVFNPLAIFIASDLNRRVSEIIKGVNFKIEKDEKAGWGGLLRIIKLKKNQ